MEKNINSFLNKISNVSDKLNLFLIYYGCRKAWLAPYYIVNVPGINDYFRIIKNEGYWGQINSPMMTKKDSKITEWNSDVSDYICWGEMASLKKLYRGEQIIADDKIFTFKEYCGKNNEFVKVEENNEVYERSNILIICNVAIHYYIFNNENFEDILYSYLCNDLDSERLKKIISMERKYNDCLNKNFKGKNFKIKLFISGC